MTEEKKKFKQRLVNSEREQRATICLLLGGSQLGYVRKAKTEKKAWDSLKNYRSVMKTAIYASGYKYG